MSRSDGPEDNNKAGAGDNPDRKEPDFSYKSRLMSGDGAEKPQATPLDTPKDAPHQDEMNIIRELIKPHLGELKSHTTKSPTEIDRNTRLSEAPVPHMLEPLPEAIKPAAPPP